MNYVNTAHSSDAILPILERKLLNLRQKDRELIGNLSNLYKVIQIHLQKKNSKLIAQIDFNVFKCHN